MKEQWYWDNGVCPVCGVKVDSPEAKESCRKRKSCVHFNQEGGNCPYPDNYEACVNRCTIRKGE